MPRSTSVPNNPTSSKTRRPLALVTGASAGIGAHFARKLAARGYDLVLVARREATLQSLAKEVTTTHKVRAEVLAADLTDAEQLATVELKLARSRRIELLVNDAGLGAFGDFQGSDRERHDAEIRLNVLALVRLTHAAVGSMLRRGGGTIINVSSTAAFAPCPSFATYGATKAFVNSFTQGIATELRDSNLRFQALCPGLTHTEIFEQAGADVSGLPDLFWMEPEDVVEESLAALENGPVVVVPGLGNRALTALVRLLPETTASRITETIGRSLIHPVES